nr:restriction endonuclease subunit S [Rhodococcus aetherivorans]
METRGTRVVQVIEGQAGLKHVAAGDFVISLRSFQGGIEYSPAPGKISPAYTILTPGREVVDRYFVHLLKSSGFVQELRSTSNQLRDGQALGLEHFAQVRVPLPPSSEQVAIAGFLDRETSRIDALIGKQEQLIATLREDRTATITLAVTKGLDPDVGVRESGVEWLGKIPQHWVPARLKSVMVSIDSGTSVNGADIPAEPGEVGVLKTSCVSGGWFNPTANKTVVDEDISRVSCPVRKDTLIVNRANTPLLVGSAGYVAHAPRNLYLSDKLWQVRFEGALASFIYYWTRTDTYRSQIAASCVGASSSMQNLSMGDFRNFALALPPEKEQAALVDFLDERCRTIDSLIDKAAEVIVTMREYRSALITAAVTGKIDVRQAVA